MNTAIINFVVMALNPERLYKNPDVAALAWAIYSAPLMQTVKDVSLVGEEWCRAMYEEHRDWFLELDADPRPLQLFLQQNDSPLIGKRFEQLLAFWFTHSHVFRLITRNVVLSENGNTRAEIDFIVEDNLDGTLMHFEVACKYYLQLNESKHWRDWPGPNGNDSLLTKIDKLRRQTSVFDTNFGRGFLSERGLQKPASFAFLKGIFFHHYTSLKASIAPLGAHSHYNSGWYCHLSELKRFRGHSAQWIVLPFSLWLCPFAFTKNDLQILSDDDLFDRCTGEINRTKKSMMLVQVILKNGLYLEISRGMVISDSFGMKIS
jgi:hypothetical protein